jgi:hypothetical protein
MSAPSLLAGLLQRNQIIFNSITGGLLCASSDAVAQYMEHKNDNETNQTGDEDTSNIDLDSSKRRRPYLAPSMVSVMSSSTTITRIDWLRVACAGGIGSFFGGIVYPMAYARLDTLWVGTKFSAVLKKSLLEIFTVGIFVNSISMTTRGILRGDQDSTSVLQHVSKELPDVTRNDFFVWLPYNILAFSMIPAVVRPTTTAAMEASWQTYISLRAHDFQQEPATTIT